MTYFLYVVLLISVWKLGIAIHAASSLLFFGICIIVSIAMLATQTTHSHVWVDGCKCGSCHKHFRADYRFKHCLKCGKTMIGDPNKYYKEGGCWATYDGCKEIDIRPRD